MFTHERFFPISKENNTLHWMAFVACMTNSYTSSWRGSCSLPADSIWIIPGFRPQTCATDTLLIKTELFWKNVLVSLEAGRFLNRLFFAASNKFQNFLLIYNRSIYTWKDGGRSHVSKWSQVHHEVPINQTILNMTYKSFLWWHQVRFSSTKVPSRVFFCSDVFIT